MAVEPERNDSRRAERRHTDAPSTLRANAAAPIDATVHDVSQTGVRIECEIELEIGQQVGIGLAGIGSRRATVMWSRDGQYGCAFDEPLPHGAVDRAFTQQTVVRLGPPPMQAPEQIAELRKASFSNGLGWLALLTFAIIVIGLLGGIVLQAHG